MKTEKVEKLVGNLHDKKKICYSFRKFKTSIKSWINSWINYELVIKFKQKAWLKLYIYTNT